MTDVLAAGTVGLGWRDATAHLCATAPQIGFVEVIVERLHADAHNHGADAGALLRAMPPADVAYLHIAGGVTRGGVYHDTHAHPVPPGPRALLARYRAFHGATPPVLLEHDADFGRRATLLAELDALAATPEALHAA